MAKKEKLTEKFKEGVSVEELEKFARKYTSEVFLIVAIIIAAISSAFGFFTGPSWSIFFAAICAIISIAIPTKIEPMMKKIVSIAYKKEKSTEIVVGVIRLVIAIFIPFILFAELGFLAGLAFHNIAKLHLNLKKDAFKETKDIEEDEHI